MIDNDRRPSRTGDIQPILGGISALFWVLEQGTTLFTSFLSIPDTE